MAIPVDVAGISVPTFALRCPQVLPFIPVPWPPSPVLMATERVSSHTWYFTIRPPNEFIEEVNGFKSDRESDNGDDCIKREV